MYKQKLMPKSLRFLFSFSLLVFALFNLTFCSLDVEDISGPVETADDRRIQDQLNKLQKKFSPIVGRYRGTFYLRKKENNSYTTHPVPFEMRLHVLPFHSGYKSDGTPIEIPRLIGHIDFSEKIVDEIEYVPFIASYNNISGQLNLSYEPKENSTLVPTVVQGQLLGSIYKGEYRTPDGVVGEMELKKFDSKVPSLSPEEIAEQKRNDFAGLYSIMTGDYIGKVTDPVTKNSQCLMITLYVTYGEAVDLRALVRWGAASGVDFPLNVKYSPFTDEIIFTPFPIAGGGVPVGSLTAYGTFKDEFLDLPHLTLAKGNVRSFRATRHDMGRTPIKNPVATCKALIGN
ncbi:MAG: hypothetical protein KDD61_10750 [Bdellovibrionales bacterium]|nr:hypothetical protein [Bdellovibrionales bacterium]